MNKRHRLLCHIPSVVSNAFNEGKERKWLSCFDTLRTDGYQDVLFFFDHLPASFREIAV